MARVKTIPLFSGGGQAQQSSGNYDQKKKLAEMLMETNDAPVWSTGQGLLGVGANVLGGILSNKAESDEKREQDSAWEQMSKALTSQAGLGDAPSPFGASSTATSGPTDTLSEGSAPRGSSGGASRSAAVNERKQRAISRFTEKGYSQHAAEGIVDNLVSESGLNPLAVGDNGTAFGLAQHRGERFANLKKYAASQGKDWKDFDTNLDFIDHEMRNGLDEGAGIAYAKLQRAQSADEAHDAFVTHFERPSAAMLAKRLRGDRLNGGGAETAYASGTGGQGGSPRRVGSPTPQFDTREADGQIQQGLALMRNPRTRAAGFQMYQQGIQTKAALRQKASELTYAQEVEEAKYQRGRADKDADEARESYTLSPGQVRYQGGRKVAEGPPKTDADIEVGPDGAIRVKTGGMVKTEQQSKDLGFYERGAAAEIELRDREEALTDFMSKNLGNIPAIGNYMKSDEYRTAEIPARQFLASLLRKDSGAAVQDHEMTLYGGMFLPQPGDKSEDIRLKRNARAVALKAIKTGLGPAEALAKSYPDLFDGKSLEPKAKPAPAATPGKAAPKDDGPLPPGISEEDRKLWKFMNPADRELLRKHYGST